MRTITKFKPDVIVIGGLSAQTHRLKSDIKWCTDQVKEHRIKEIDSNTDLAAEEKYRQRENAEIEIIYVWDEVARIYQNSSRAVREFETMSPTARYCVALARFVQNPVCEYAALGPDLESISFDPHQKLVRKQ